jgi:hypothetical protein
MSWTIDLPHRGDPTEPLLTVVDAARVALQGDDRAIARQIALELMSRGFTTVGAALEVLEAASPAERRVLLDDARQAAGLPSSAQADRARARAREVPMTGAPARDPAGYALQPCAICGTMPVRSDTGGPMATRARRWHCPAHEHLATSDDRADWTPRIVVRAERVGRPRSAGVRARAGAGRGRAPAPCP